MAPTRASVKQSEILRDVDSVALEVIRGQDYSIILLFGSQGVIMFERLITSVSIVGAAYIIPRQQRS